ncbi:metallophosphoesterase [Streptomyces sp. NPDC126499]|uniref:metallophosphoesterase n=1 Tax=Streptomyces sp. NPDC126499 TaxID=3155314 RepID=UPI0033340D69
MIVIAHLSDIHVDGGPRSRERTRATMEFLDSLAYDFDAVIVTGDLADHGTESEYRWIRDHVLTSRHPVLTCPGNHDRRDAFRRVLLGAEPSSPEAPVNQMLRADGFVLALCDSSVPGKDEGLLEDETLAWLEAELARTPEGTPVFVGFHHPPATLGIPFVDGIRQFGEDRLAELVRRHPSVTAFLCGHSHTAAATTFAGRPLLVAPGVVSTSKLPWEQTAGPSDYVYRDEMAPSLAFHLLSHDGRLTTHYRSVPLGNPSGARRTMA